MAVLAGSYIPLAVEAAEAFVASARLVSSPVAYYDSTIASSAASSLCLLSDPPVLTSHVPIALLSSTSAPSTYYTSLKSICA